MLDTHSADQLAGLLNQFSVPMFAAERPTGKHGFRYICINQTLSSATGFQPDTICGRDLCDFLPEKVAKIMMGNLTRCADMQQGFRCRETWETPLGWQEWDTTLQHVQLPSGADRVIGTAFQVTQDRSPDSERATFDNIRFHSSLAEMQLQNLVSLFEATRDQGLFSHDSLNRVTRLCGICRTVQRSVADIRDAVRQTRPLSTMHAPALEAPQDPADFNCIQGIGQQTTRAIYDSAREVVLAAD